MANARGYRLAPCTPAPRRNAETRWGLQYDFTEVGYRNGESPSEEFEFGAGGSAKRRLKLNARDIFDEVYNAPVDAERGAISQILGYSTRVGAGVNLHRWIPELHPVYPFMAAKKVSVSYIGENQRKSNDVNCDWSDLNILANKINSYEFAILEIEYDTPSYQLRIDSDILNELGRYVSVEPKPNGDYLSLPTGGMKWSEGAAPPAGQKGLAYPAQTGIIVPTIDFVLTWHQVPAEALPLNAFLAAIGHVNSDTSPKFQFQVKDTFKEFDPHTLLLTGIEANKQQTPYGTWYYDVKYTMKYNPQTHNRFLQFYNNTKNFYQISINDTFYDPNLVVPNGKLVFDEYSFYNLFLAE